MCVCVCKGQLLTETGLPVKMCGMGHLPASGSSSKTVRRQKYMKAMQGDERGGGNEFGGAVWVMRHMACVREQMLWCAKNGEGTHTLTHIQTLV